MARSASTGASARLHLTAGDDPSAEQREAASSIRAEGKSRGTMDRTSPRCCGVRWRSEGIP